MLVTVTCPPVNGEKSYDVPYLGCDALTEEDGTLVVRRLKETKSPSDGTVTLTYYVPFVYYARGHWTRCLIEEEKSE